MKYYTLQWWANRVNPEKAMAVGKRYCRYIESVQASFPPDLKRLHWEVSLHDSHVRRLHFSDCTFELQLDVERTDKDKIIPGTRRFRLTYQDVRSFTAVDDPEAALGGPDGYGDLGYDEIEVVQAGVYEHRMLFSSSIELQVRFTGFALV